MTNTARCNDTDFDVILKTGVLFEKLVSEVYGASISANQRHRLANLLYDLVQEAKGENFIDWKNSKVIDFQQFRNRIQ